MEAIVFDHDEQRRWYLTEFINPREIEGLDGQFGFFFSTPVENLYIEAGYKVAVKNLDGNYDFYVAHKVFQRTQGERSVFEVECSGAHFELGEAELLNFNFAGVNAWYAISNILDSQYWQVGAVEVETTRTVNMISVTPLKALTMLANHWGGELRFRVTMSGTGISGRYVDLLYRRGNYTGKRFEFGYDLEEVTIDVDRSEMATAMYGWGIGVETIETEEGLQTQRLDFEDVEWIEGEEAELHPEGLTAPAPVNKPAGQKWVGDEEARELYGRYNPVTGQNEHVFKEYDSQAHSGQALLWETWRQLQKINEPRVIYNVRAKLLEEMAGYSHEKIRLGDTCLIKSSSFETMTARIIYMDRNRVNPNHTTVELGNFTPVYSDSWAEAQERLREFSGRAGIWDRAGLFTPDYSLPSSVLDDLIPEINNQILVGGGHVHISDGGDGLWITDTPDPEDALGAIRGVAYEGQAALTLATRDSTLDAWEWRVGMTAEGIWGDQIVAGTIEADKMNVQNLSAITAYFTELSAGSVSDFVRLHEEGDQPFIDFYDDAILRMQLTSDRLQLFTPAEEFGGSVVGEEDPVHGLPAISVLSPFMSRLLSVDTIYTGRSAGLASRVHSGDLNLEPQLQLYATDDENQWFSFIDVGKDVHVNCWHGEIQFDGIVRIAGIDGTDPTKRYRIMKNGVDGVGIINFKCG